MVTPISNNLNIASNSLSSIERPRPPRRMAASDSVSFTGKFSPAKAAKGVKGFFGKIIGTVKKGAHNLVHSNAVQTVKTGTVKGFHKTVNIIKSIPGKIGNLFKKITKKSPKKV